MGIRTYIAGTLPNSPQHLTQWIEHPQQVHPGTAMPEMGVTPQDANDMAQYLEQLR
jgi:cytochrome c1